MENLIILKKTSDNSNVYDIDYIVEAVGNSDLRIEQKNKFMSDINLLMENYYGTNGMINIKMLNEVAIDNEILIKITEAKDYSKKDIAHVLSANNIYGDKYSEDEVPDDMVPQFNTQMNALTDKYPDLDPMHSEDYLGPADDEFYDALVSLTEPHNIKLFDQSKLPKGGSGANAGDATNEKRNYWKSSKSIPEGYSKPGDIISIRNTKSGIVESGVIYDKTDKRPFYSKRLDSYLVKFNEDKVKYVKRDRIIKEESGGDYMEYGKIILSALKNAGFGGVELFDTESDDSTGIGSGSFGIGGDEYMYAIDMKDNQDEKSDVNISVTTPGFDIILDKELKGQSLPDFAYALGTTVTDAMKKYLGANKNVNEAAVGRPAEQTLQFPYNEVDNTKSSADYNKAMALLRTDQWKADKNKMMCVRDWQSITIEDADLRERFSKALTDNGIKFTTKANEAADTDKPGGFEYKTVDTSTEAGLKKAEKMKEQGWTIISVGISSVQMEKPKTKKANEDAGTLPEGTETIYIDSWPYYVTKIDTTHYEMVNSKDAVGKGNGMAAHSIGELGQDHPAYNDVKSWLKGGDPVDGKKYTTKANESKRKTNEAKQRFGKSKYMKMAIKEARFKRISRKLNESITIPYNKDINTIQDVKDFYLALLNAGVSFHPDDSFENTVDGNGNDSFTPEEAVRLDKLMDRCFDVVGTDDNKDNVYNLGIDVMKDNNFLPKEFGSEDTNESVEAGLGTKYHAKWGNWEVGVHSYDDDEKDMDVSEFTTDAGYEPTDIEAIKNLKAGETWHSSMGNHTVTALADGAATDIVNEAMDKGSKVKVISKDDKANYNKTGKITGKKAGYIMVMMDDDADEIEWPMRPEDLEAVSVNEDSAADKPCFGIKPSEATKAEKALKDADIEFSKVLKDGVANFMFVTKELCTKAANLVKKYVDTDDFINYTGWAKETNEDTSQDTLKLFSVDASDSGWGWAVVCDTDAESAEQTMSSEFGDSEVYVTPITADMLRSDVDIPTKEGEWVRIGSDDIINESAGYQEAVFDDKPCFGIKPSEAAKAEKALKDADIEFSKTLKDGVDCFIFLTKELCNKAVNLVKKYVDTDDFVDYKGWANEAQKNGVGNTSKKITKIKEDNITQAHVEKGGMHKDLGIPAGDKIEDHYKSGSELASALVGKVGKEKASQMLNYAANINSNSDSIFHAAAASVKNESKGGKKINEAAKTMGDLQGKCKELGIDDATCEKIITIVDMDDVSAAAIKKAIVKLVGDEKANKLDTFMNEGKINEVIVLDDNAKDIVKNKFNDKDGTIISGDNNNNAVFYGIIDSAKTVDDLVASLDKTYNISSKQQILKLLGVGDIDEDDEAGDMGDADMSSESIYLPASSAPNQMNEAISKTSANIKWGVKGTTIKNGKKVYEIKVNGKKADIDKIRKALIGYNS